jgi:predicted TIM-barrel fold metal-dependent hydrolase
MSSINPKVIDIHLHVGLLGDRWKEWGCMSPEYRKKTVYEVFLFFSGVNPNQVSDTLLREKTLKTIATSHLDKVVCLALDPVYSPSGVRQEENSYIWVDNDYVLDLRKELPEKILLGASVHPYDPNFEDRVKKYVDAGAVLVKWLPSAQRIDLAEEKVLKAMRFLATALPGGKPLPLLLHVGSEYAIPSTDERTSSYDYLSWSKTDSAVNFFRFNKKWFVPQVKKIQKNIENALQQGAIIIFAHCGLPYFSSGFLGNLLEHSEFGTVKDYLKRTSQGEFKKGQCFADVSALVTPFRKRFFPEARKLPQELLLFGSDFPTPAFELSADKGEMGNDLKAIMKGDLRRIVVPQDNLLDVNLRELRNAFPDSSLFTNFSRLGFDRGDNK